MVRNKNRNEDKSNNKRSSLQKLVEILIQFIPIIVLKTNFDLRKKNDVNKIIMSSDINQIILQNNKINKINIKYLQEDYKTSIKVKNKVEDKAKAIIITLTITIAMILNLSEIINEAITKLQKPYLVFIFAICSIVYMICASIMSMQILLKENIIYFTSLEERTIKTSIYQVIQQNNNQNLIRNNLIYAAYISIRNSIICLLVIFIMAVFPYQSIKTVTRVNDNCYTVIMHKDDTINQLMNNFQKKFDWSKAFQRYIKCNTKD